MKTLFRISINILMLSSIPSILIFGDKVASYIFMLQLHNLEEAFK
jgi:hypothetical protein